MVAEHSDNIVMTLEDLGLRNFRSRQEASEATPSQDTEPWHQFSAA